MKAKISVMAIVASAFMFSSSAQAQIKSNNTKDAFCQNIGELASNVMTMRQMDVPMTKVMAIINTHASDASVDQNSVSFARNLVIKAYERPSFSTEQYVQKAVIDFRNEVEVACYRALNK